MDTVQRPPVDPLNEEQARAWDGEEGSYWAEHADAYDAAVAAYHRPFLDAAGIASTDRVLDIGCGSGQTTRDAARLAISGSSLGVDLSSQLVAVARQRSEREGLRNVRFEQGDAQVYPFEAEPFDVAISRTGAMFFGDPVAAFTNVARGLVPDGRLVLLVWRSFLENEWIRELFGALAYGRDLAPPPPDAPGPFSLSDPDRVRSILGAAGFSEIALEPRSESMYFGSDVAGAEAFLIGQLGWLIADLQGSEREEALDRLRATLQGHATPAGVTYDSAGWFISARKRNGRRRP